MESSTGSSGLSLNAADLKHSVQYAAFCVHVRKCPLKNVTKMYDVFINKKKELVEYFEVHGQFAEDLTRGVLSKLKYDLPDHSSPQQGMTG